MLNIYCDGACSGNGKESSSGGFGIAILNKEDKVLFTHSEYCENTTNNREELKAIIRSLLYCIQKKEFCQVYTIYSDSSYAVQTYNSWMQGWKNRGWLKADKKVPENLDLIKILDQLKEKIKEEQLNVTIEHVKGHSGTKGNEIVDALASKNLQKLKKYDILTL